MDEFKSRHECFKTLFIAGHLGMESKSRFERGWLSNYTEALRVLPYKHGSSNGIKLDSCSCCHRFKPGKCLTYFDHQNLTQRPSIALQLYCLWNSRPEIEAWLQSSIIPYWTPFISSLNPSHLDVSTNIMKDLDICCWAQQTEL